MKAENPNPPIDFTLAAALKVKSLIDEEGDPNIHLRVGIEGGGCSGFKYNLTFDKDIQADDVVIEKGSVKLVVDAMSFQFLQGAKIDYRDDGINAEFVISNPNAKTTCGCGSSFSN